MPDTPSANKSFYTTDTAQLNNFWRGTRPFIEVFVNPPVGEWKFKS